MSAQAGRIVRAIAWALGILLATTVLGWVLLATLDEAVLTRWP